MIDGDPWMGYSTVFDPVSSKFIFANTNGDDPQGWDSDNETVLLFQDGLCSGIPLVKWGRNVYSTFLKGDNWAYWNSGKFYTILVDKLITVDVTNPPIYGLLDGVCSKQQLCNGCENPIQVYKAQEITMGFNLPLYYPLRVMLK